MEFLRFGSSIPGGYWGCCAFDIAQCFKQNPDDKASISVVNGDGGFPMMDGKGVLFLGPTWHDIFKQRLRINTFDTKDKPNHGFLVVLTDWQLKNEPGKSWLKILKEEGFEFLRTVDNSVYSGSSVIESATDGANKSSHKNYLFGLFRNIGTGYVGNPYKAPTEWTKLEQVVPEAWQMLSKDEMKELNQKNQEHHLKRWHEIGKVKFLHEEDLTKMGVKVTYAGMRSRYPEQDKATREALLKEEEGWKAGGKKSVTNDVFGKASSSAPADELEDIDFD